MSRFRLRRDEKGYCLEDSFSTFKPLRAGFNTSAFRRRLDQAGRRSELVARAIGARAGLTVLDCTAGLGRDGFILASLGCRVHMCERSPVIAALLEDALADARGDAELATAAARINLHRGDAIPLMDSLQETDVIYIDPMFPARSSAARVNGDMQQLQAFLGTDQDASDLLSHALHSGVQKIVLKRPARSDWSPPLAPSHVVSSRNARYEVFVR